MFPVSPLVCSIGLDVYGTFDNSLPIVDPVPTVFKLPRSYMLFSIQLYLRIDYAHDVVSKQHILNSCNEQIT